MNLVQTEHGLQVRDGGTPADRELPSLAVAGATAGEAGSGPVGPLPDCLMDAASLRTCGIWAPGQAPSVRQLSRWVRARKIPFVDQGPRSKKFHPPTVRAWLLEQLTVRPPEPRPKTPPSGNVFRPRGIRPWKQQQHVAGVGRSEGPRSQGRDKRGGAS